MMQTAKAREVQSYANYRFSVDRRSGGLAGKIMHSKGGLLRNILVGIVGGALGGWLGSLIGVNATGWISSILIGIGGSCLLIWIMRKLFK